MFKKFIDRPVLATVISILLVLLGIVGITQLPITRFPDIAPPSVSVSASYTGADAETVAEGVLQPLEEDINGVKGMTYMESQASTGSGTIQVYFEQGTDPDQAAVNVNNRTSKSLSDLPEETVASGISVTPRQAGVVMTLNIYSTDPASFNETFINVYVTREITRELLRIDGVASASKIGSRNYAMRIWLNPNKMNAYGLVPGDIEQAVNDQNFTMAPGQFGQNSDQAFQRVIKYTGRFTSQEEFENIVVKTQEDGAILHLKDVARVELGPTNANNVNRVDGQPGTTMNITQNVGANAREIDIAVREKMEELAQDFPSGIEYNISYSVRNQIDQSVNQVIQTLLEALLLVFIVVFIFLQDLRSTIIPAIAVPVSLVGAFFFIYLLGFSINVLTLFALVLSIGIVVDDAIIVVEAVHEKLETTNLTAKNATFLAMEEITPAILSITMVMAAVFLPIGFMSGSSGMFYQQFGYTIAIAIIISAVNALTLSPALCALFLKNTHEAEVPAQEPQTLRGKANGYINRFFVAFNASFNTMKYKYIRAVNYLIRKWKVGIGGFILVTLTGFLFMYITPTGFIPTEDDGFISYSIKLPPSSSLARTTNVLNEVNDILQDREEILTRSSSSGYNAVDGNNSPSYAVGYISMYPHGERKGITDRGEFIDTLRQELSGISGADINIFTRPTVSGFGEQSGAQFVLQDQLGSNFQSFGAVSDTILQALNNRPEISEASTTFEPTFPKYELSIDADKANVMGVGVKDLLANFRQYYSRVRISDFVLFNRLNRVYLQAEPQYTETSQSLESIFVKSEDGNMVPINALINMERTLGPETVTRFNLFNSVEVNTSPAQGHTSGQVMDAVAEVTNEYLPGNYQYEWTGLSREESQSSAQAAFIILLSFLFVYFLLAAKYESYIVPFSIILSVPVGLIGVYTAVNLVGLQNNIYVQVGLIMLIGLLAKNAILIVEFSEQHRNAGYSIYQAAIKGARIRLRPILMTSMAFVAGLVPLMWTGGPSAMGNHSISYAAAGGMISGVALGILFVPLLYMIFRNIDEKLTSWQNGEDQSYA